MSPLQVRPIRDPDNAAMAAVIRTVMPEYGAVGPGFSIMDPEVDFISRAYDRPGAAYFVVEEDAVVVGGAGIAPLEGGGADTCELRKMYLLRQARGRGAGVALLDHCLAAARAHGYRRCYAESIAAMETAGRFYERAGFRRIEAPLGVTGHRCDRFYLLDL